MYKPPIKNRIVEFFKSRSLLSVLIIANVAMWLLLLLAGFVASLFAHPSTFTQTHLLKWLALPSRFDDFVRSPWTLLTHMFVHTRFWTMAFNMALLYFAGSLTCRYIGAKKMGWIYFLSGLMGALVFLVVYNLFPVGQFHTFYLTESTMAVVGVFTALFTYMPRYETTFTLVRPFTIKLQYIYIATVAIFLLTIPEHNPGALFALVGSGLCGFGYIKLMQRAKKPQGPKKRHKAHKHKQHEPQRHMSDEEFNYRKNMNQKRVDDILEKIAKSGYDKLTKEEKDFLFNYKA